MAKYESFSEQDTFFIGERMGQHATPGTVVALDGDLGVGKTVFTKGFARGLGIEEDVVSPTFTIEQIYEEGRLPLYHFDIYRLEDEDEWYAIGADEALDSDGVCLIEWASKMPEIMPKDTIWVTIEKDLDKGFDYRIITIGEPEVSI